MTVVSVCGVAVGMMASAQAVGAQDTQVVEVPVRVEAGRLLVAVETASGEEVDFILGLGSSYITASGSERIGTDVDGLTLAGVPVRLGAAQVVPDDLSQIDGGSAPAGVAGIVGGETLNSYDVLIDVPAGRVLLKPWGRSVRWEGVELTNGVGIQVLHDYLIRTQVEIGDEVFSALFDLAAPTMVVSEPAGAAAGVRSGPVDFRMGYSAFPALTTRVVSLPFFGGWVAPGEGFVMIGAPVAYDCAIAISYRHAEMRTCIR